jgi:hypothetical protein
LYRSSGGFCQVIFWQNYFFLLIKSLENWHTLCKVSGIGARMVRTPPNTGSYTMFAQFESAQRVATSVVAAVMFAAVLVAAAVPVIPVA